MKEILVECPTCDGTCKVHSHNNKCPDCKRGLVSVQKRKNLLDSEKRLEITIPRRTWDYV